MRVNITVNNKVFIVCPPRAYRASAGYIVGYTYWGTRNGAGGDAFGSTRTATEQIGKPSSVGVKLAVAAREHFGTDNDALIATAKAADLARVNKKLADAKAEGDARRIGWARDELDWVLAAQA